MRKEKNIWILMIGMFLFLPYFITSLILGAKWCLVSKRQKIETYVAGLAASQIPWEYPEEAIKAQIILARTNLYFSYKQGKEKEIIHAVTAFFRQKHMNQEQLEQFALFQKAAHETKGEVLVLNNQIKELPYHAISAGKTRDGKGILGDAYKYIPSVQTAKDIDSPQYIEGCYFSFQELENKLKKECDQFSFGENRIIEVKERDQADYVMKIQIGSQTLQGEKVKDLLKLPSSCFTIQISGDKVRFLCRGKGHGLGMSQYQAAQMALEGKKYEEILKVFFPELILKKVKEGTSAFFIF